MKRKYKSLLALLLLVLCSGLIYAYFHVAGREIAGVSEISDSCTVTIQQYQHLNWDTRTTYVLEPEQVDQLRELLLNSSFTRDLSNTVYFNDRDAYYILIDFNNQQDYLSINCIGNEYISVVDQFDGKHLKINNSNWKSTLEELISASPN